jgi:mannose-6-phosphate isomerase-like protein (cupin superfamily)
MNSLQADIVSFAGEVLSKERLTNSIVEKLGAGGYTPVEIVIDKPWGAFIRLQNDDANAFIAEFFPGLTLEEARLGVEEAELSPKILIVSPHERLSWQYHDRRAERWAFLTRGAYHKSMTDDEGALLQAHPGAVVQFAQGERHRLVGVEDEFVIVAEIWQHTDADRPSDEDDIVRLHDQYGRIV